MSVREYVFHSTSTLTLLREKIEEAVGEWQADWGVHTTSLDIEVIRSWEEDLAKIHWQQEYLREHSLWFGWSGAHVDELIWRAMFSSGHAPVKGYAEKTVSASAARRAWEELLARVSGLFGFVQTDKSDMCDSLIEKECSRYASGFIVVHIRFADIALSCLLDVDAVLKLCPMNRLKDAVLPPVAIGTLFKSEPVSLHVELGNAQVDIVNLLELRIGDVLRLEKKADDPLHICGPDGSAMLLGHLGSRQGNMAIEVTDVYQSMGQ